MIFLTLMNGFLYGIGTILANLFLAVVFTLFTVCVFVLPDWLKKVRCKHEKYFENMACHAICGKCRKDLGFIGTVRKERNYVRV